MPPLTPKIVRVLAAALVLSVPVLTIHAQSPANGAASSSPGPIQPLPPLSDGSSGIQPPVSEQSQPDTHLLSGAETFGLGSLLVPGAVFDFSVRAGESAETGLLPGQTQGVTYVGGTLSLDHQWERNSLSLIYDGNDTFYRPDSLYDLPYQEFGISQLFQVNRWSIRLRDDVLYSPNAGFGGLYTGGPGSIGELPTLNSLVPTILPEETIETGPASRLSNTSIGEIDYSISPRTTVTFTGSYGLLRFFQAGFINSADIVGAAGYDYALSVKTSLALTYSYGLTQYTGTDSRIATNQLQASFGRKVTGRLAFQIAGGPQLVAFQNYGPFSGQQLSWSAYTALTYQPGRTAYTMDYFHGIGSGSGVLFGSTVDAVSVGISRQLTRFWSLSVHAGDAINRAVATDIPGVSVSSATRFENRFVGVNLSRQIGRHIDMTLNYQYQQQVSNSEVCGVAICTIDQPVNVAGMTLAWHPRQIVLK